MITRERLATGGKARDAPETRTLTRRAQDKARRAQDKRAG